MGVILDTRTLWVAEKTPFTFMAAMVANITSMEHYLRASEDFCSSLESSSTTIEEPLQQQQSMSAAATPADNTHMQVLRRIA